MARSGRAEKTREALMNSPRIWTHVTSETNQTYSVLTNHEKALFRHTSGDVEVRFEWILIRGVFSESNGDGAGSLPLFQNGFAHVQLLGQADTMSITERRGLNKTYLSGPALAFLLQQTGADRCHTQTI